MERYSNLCARSRHGLEWNLSIEGTTGSQLAVLYREVSLFRGRFGSMWLGLQAVSSLERCPLFRVSFIERFHCTCRITSPRVNNKA